MVLRAMSGWGRARSFTGLCALTLAAGSAITAGLATAPAVLAAPEPDPVPRRWELQIEPGPLRSATIDVPNYGPRKFFYMTYRVINNSGQDLLFAPAFELADGDGHLIRSGRDVPQYVTQELLQSTQNPFIQDQISIIGEFLQGSENAKDGLVIWPAIDLNPSSLTVYAAGFSGETKAVPTPDGKDKFILRKTRRLDYDTPGDLTQKRSEPIPLRSKNWIMR